MDRKSVTFCAMAKTAPLFPATEADVMCQGDGKLNRRNMLRVGLPFMALPSTILYLGCTPDRDNTPQKTNGSPAELTRLTKIPKEIR